MKQGDTVRLTFAGRTVPATVAVVSPNKRSVVLTFETVLGGYPGAMALSLDDSDTYRDFLHRDPATIEEGQH